MAALLAPADFPPDEMAARRMREAVLAADRLGVELVPLALPENAWTEATLAKRLSHLLATLDPDVIYTPSPVDYHPEHLKVARAVAAVLALSERPLVRVWELGVPLTATLTNLIASVDAEEPPRREALAAYTTVRTNDTAWLELPLRPGATPALAGRRTARKPANSDPRARQRRWYTRLVSHH